MSKQAFYKRLKSQKAKEYNESIVLKLVKECRNKVGHQTGGKKLYDYLKKDLELNNIKLGRDRLFNILRDNRLLVRKTKQYHVTTNSKHYFYKYKNLVKDKVPTRPEQLWVTDITYIKTQHGHNYLALVTDAYSKKIMGYKLDNNMRTELCLDALKMALKNRKYPNQKLIHHSDRGIQYCNPMYTEFAEKNGLQLSMTEQYDPYQNAVAERINKTLKYEYGLKNNIKNTQIAQKMTKKAIFIYNYLRKHWSLDFETPNHVHLNKNKPYKSYRKNKKQLEFLTI
ncbi:IS3 family transposase [Croceivirga sp. JEA036]|uniref:IS3 family transposase n=1 Tax=Croceivirga sp. JEA036 TaxID=2721162 RepID=UPI001F114EB2|nr:MULTISPECIES: IS3 family transposase [Flavobacteriaceae]